MVSELFVQVSDVFCSAMGLTLEINGWSIKDIIYDLYRKILHIGRRVTLLEEASEEEDWKALDSVKIVTLESRIAAIEADFIGFERRFGLGAPAGCQVMRQRVLSEFSTNRNI